MENDKNAWAYYYLAGAYMPKGMPPDRQKANELYLKAGGIRML